APAPAPPRRRQRWLDPPGGITGDGDAGGSDEVADLPRARNPVLLDVEVRRDAEVALASGRKPDVAPNPRHLECPHRVAVEVVAHDVPVAVVEPECVRVHDTLGGSGAARA